MRYALLTLPLIAACTQAPAPMAPAAEPPAFVEVGELVLSTRGYRTMGDACRMAGESDVTAPLLDDAADLVACPIGTPLNEPSALPMLENSGYQLYVVPKG